MICVSVLVLLLQIWKKWIINKINVLKYQTSQLIIKHWISFTLQKKNAIWFYVKTVSIYQIEKFKKSNVLQNINWVQIDLCTIFEEDPIDLRYGSPYKHGMKLPRNKLKQTCKSCWDSIRVRTKNHGQIRWFDWVLYLNQAKWLAEINHRKQPMGSSYWHWLSTLVQYIYVVKFKVIESIKCLHV